MRRAQSSLRLHELLAVFNDFRFVLYMIGLCIVIVMILLDIHLMYQYRTIAIYVFCTFIRMDYKWYVMVTIDLQHICHIL